MDNRRWNTREIVLAANLGVVFGLLFFGWGFIWEFAAPLAASGLQEILYGFWFIAGIVVPYIIRKPGAAIFGETLAALTSMLIGSQWGLVVLLTGVFQGAASELVFALTGYRRWNLPILMAAGAAAAVASFVVDYVYFLSTLTPALLAISFVVRIFSAMVLAGGLGKAIGDALARTGVLASYAIGKEREETI